MRFTASSIKRNGKGTQLQEKPREGTKTRKVYDEFMTGDWVSFPVHKNNARLLEQLRDYYGLEIRSKEGPRVPNSGRGRPASIYKCIGIWDGADLRSLQDVEVAIDFTQKEED